VTAKEMLLKMPEALIQEAVGDTSAVIQYELSEPIYQVLEAGELSVYEGRAETPDLTVTMSDDDLVSLFQGQLNGMSAFMSGKIKINGNMMLAQQLVGFVDQRRMTELA